MNRPITIRSANPDDAPCVSGLAVAVWLDTYAPDGLRPDLAREAFALHGLDATRRRLASGDTTCLLAERAGHLVGFTELRRDSPCPVPGTPSMVELAHLYVHTPLHRSGIGATLLLEAERAAGEPPWLAVWTRNRTAAAFYRAHGYAEVGRTEHRVDGAAHANRMLVGPSRRARRGGGSETST